MDTAYGPLGVVGVLEGELLLEEGGGGALLKGRICPWHPLAVSFLAAPSERLD